MLWSFVSFALVAFGSVNASQFPFCTGSYANTTSHCSRYQLNAAKGNICVQPKNGTTFYDISKLPYTHMSSALVEKKALLINNVFENGNTQYAYSYVQDLGDGRGYTSGRIGFTTGTNDAYAVVKAYVKARPKNNPLARYLRELARLSALPFCSLERAKVTGLKGYPAAWKQAACTDKMFRDVQDRALNATYFEPSMRFAAMVGLTTNLGKAIFYDTIIQHGWQYTEPKINLWRLIILTGPWKKSETEQSYLMRFLETRRGLMCCLDSTWASSADRVDDLQQVLKTGDLAMNGDINLVNYGVTHIPHTPAATDEIVGSPGWLNSNSDICVDYLSHKFDEADLAASWRVMTKQKLAIVNGVRLENASWRTWAKERRHLKTVSPETLNWSKDSDVTWLYGPLHTVAKDPDPYEKSVSHTALDTLDLLNNGTHKLKSALKKKTRRELLRTSSSTQLLLSPNPWGSGMGSGGEGEEAPSKEVIAAHRQPRLRFNDFVEQRRVLASLADDKTEDGPTSPEDERESFWRDREGSEDDSDDSSVLEMTISSRASSRANSRSTSRAPSQVSIVRLAPAFLKADGGLDDDEVIARQMSANAAYHRRGSLASVRQNRAAFSAVHNPDDDVTDSPQSYSPTETDPFLSPESSSPQPTNIFTLIWTLLRIARGFIIYLLRLLFRRRP
ncbi:hypothetical protein BZG36_04499 [Bifiguratus adelaidae]|uniref:Nitrogen regulatory protein areA GATA-like domain-containing protein n=1 Tax=Bifiguratus adelaidae TaxID=1938954 RepID=A0A261XW19_9FUNG|nr:hypothetical protein BZG36_04499 [Bifiguratus adelaidae]